MNPRVEYEMTEADLAAILDACKSVPVMLIGGYAPASPQENANRAWAALGSKMGFDPMTVRPMSGRGQRFFTAVPSETEEQRTEREARETAEQKQLEIEQLTREIADRKKRIVELGGNV